MSVSVAQLVVSRRASGGDDRIAVFHRERDVVVALADGAGGMAAASRAADTAILEVRRQLEANGGLLPQALVRAADRAVHALAVGGQTTLVVAMVAASGLLGASVGDSEAWLVTENGVARLTERQQRRPLLGVGDAAAVPFSAAPFDGTLLVASDGLFKYARMADIVEVVRSPIHEEVPGRVVDLVRLRSGALQDDVAVAVCRAPRAGR